MRRIGPVRIILCIFIAALALTSALYQPVAAQDSTRTHTVREGDTLTSIATKYGVSVDAIVSANKLKDANSLYIGQVLKIPVRGSSQSSQGAGQSTGAQAIGAQSASPGTYTVKPGDTLIGIAGRYGVTVDALMAANKIKDAAVVQIGQVLKIPDQNAGAGSFSDASAVLSVPPFSDGEQTLTAPGGPSINFRVENGRLVSLTLMTTSSGKQGFPLSCEAKIAQQIAQMYGLAFDETSFMAAMPHSLNPKRGFVGAYDGRFYNPRDLIGGTATGPGGYGVHVEGWSPIFTALSGFQVQTLSSYAATAGQQIDTALRHGYPVAVWAVLGFKENIAKNSVWLGASADGAAIDCGGPASGCSYLVSGEHAYLIVGRTDNSYLIFDPGKGEISYFQRNAVIYGITTLFAYPTGSAPGAVIVAAGRVPDLSRLPGW